MVRLFVLPSVVTMEEMAGDGYSGKDGDPTMAAQEQSHARLLRQITGTSADGMQGAALAQIEGRHKGTPATRCARQCSAPTTGWCPI